MSNHGNRTSITLIDVTILSKRQRKEFDGILPVGERHQITIIDHDARQCRFISEDELSWLFVDNNIERMEPIEQALFLTPKSPIDTKNLILHYAHGASLIIKLGDISLDGNFSAPEYCKINGIIFPMDRHGALMLDATNTPRLAGIRRDLLLQVNELTAEAMDLLTIGHIIGGILGKYSSGR